MALVMTERITGNRFTQDSPDARNYTMDAERIWDVTVDNPTAYDSFTIATLVNDPHIRAQYPDDPFLRASHIDIVRTSPIRFEVHATYFARGNLAGGPLSLPPVIRWSGIATEEEMPYDVNGNPLMTIAQEHFDPPIRVPVYDRVVSITRNVIDYSEDWAGSFRNAVNSAPWFGIAAGRARLIELTGESVADDTNSYWRVTGEFQIRTAPPGKTDSYAWFYPIAAMGYLCKDGSGNVQRCTVNAIPGGEPSPVPCAHDVNTGVQLTPGAPIQYYFFQMFPQADFNLLGLI